MAAISITFTTGWKGGASEPPMYDSAGRYLNSNAQLAPIFHYGDVSSFDLLIANALVARGCGTLT